MRAEPDYIQLGHRVYFWLVFAPPCLVGVAYELLVEADSWTDFTFAALALFGAGVAAWLLMVRVLYVRRQSRRLKERARGDPSG
jgi:hypothetical protein